MLYCNKAAARVGSCKKKLIVLLGCIKLGSYIKLGRVYVLFKVCYSRVVICIYFFKLDIFNIDVRITASEETNVDVLFVLLCKKTLDLLSLLEAVNRFCLTVGVSTLGKVCCC
ncbi:MAG: hypothetical protein IKS17_00520 [Firmicutes bacterium]|nr:hypothetical protein [Bacillota bacterium]